MRNDRVSMAHVVLTVLLASALWAVAFAAPWGVFWVKITASAAALALLSLWLRPDRDREMRFRRKEFLIGGLSAALLYGIFQVGKFVSTALFPFAESQIGNIYGKGEGTPMWIIFLLLCFITGPCEELYWRGYLQRRLMDRFGNLWGWFLATSIYAGVHIWSWNFMLIGAAGVAGAFWGALYWRLGSLSAVIVSHALWSAFIFAVAPV